jgi:hypothetical protein
MICPCTILPLQQIQVITFAASNISLLVPYVAALDHILCPYTYNLTVLPTCLGTDDVGEGSFGGQIPVL